MDKRLGASTGLAALLVVILHMFSGGSDRPANATPSKKEAASDSSAAQDSAKTFNSEGPWVATQQYFHRAPVAVAAGCGAYLLFSEPTEPAGCDRSALLDFYGFEKDFQSGDLTALVATVPDPLHTRMSVETDRYLDAIQQAAYRSGWELANQWLPWVLKAHGASVTASAPGGDLEKLPGLLVFRRHFTAPDVISKILLVFVVGETPTAGINGFQWEVALRSLLTLRSADSGRMAIVGPNFSGSFPSLTRFILADKNFQYYEVRAGSVSNLNYAATMLDTLKEKNFLINVREEGKKSITFHASTLPSRSFKKQFLQLAASWRYEKDQLAELIEDESGFAFQPSSANSAHSADSWDGVVTYRYPRDIAQLRNAYSDVAFANNQKQDSNAVPALDFSLKDTQSGEGNFPIFSTNHTPVSQNAVLEQIVRGLNRKHIRVVNLTSTNVFDTIFLAKVLAQYCPDTRIVLSGADLLFVQEAGRSSLAGVMAISPFPMFPQGAAWSNPAMHDVTTFADADSIGVYNATRLLLEGDSAAERQQYQPALPASSDDFLSAWLLVLGRSGWLPVDLLTQNNPPLPLQHAGSLSGQLSAGPRWFDDRLKTDASPGPPRALPPVGQGWTALCVLVAAVVIGFCARFYYLKGHCCMLVWSILCLGDLGRRDTQASITRLVHFRYLCLIACFAVLAFTDSILLSPLTAARFVHGSPAGNALLEAVIWVAFLLPLGTAVYLFCLVPLRVCEGGQGSVSPSGARLSAQVFLLRTAVLALPIAGLVCWWFCCANGVKGQLVCFRAFTLSPPVSPVWPLLLSAVALFVIALFHLRRFTWADRQQPLLNTALFDESLWNQFGGLEKRLDRILLSPVRVAELSGPSVVVAITVVSVLLLMVLFPYESLRSFESNSFEWLLISMLLPLSVFMTLSFVQFAACWSVVRAFLATLRSVVLGRFFTRLPDFNGSGPIWMREVKVLSLATSVNSSIALHNLHNLTSSCLVQSWRNRYWQALAALLSQERPQRSRRLFIRDYQTFRETAASITDELGRKILKPYWAVHKIDFVDAETVADGKGQTRDADKTSEASATLVAIAEPVPDSPLSNDLPDPVTTEAYELASKYIAMQYAAFIGYALRHLQNLLLCCTICFVLLVLALNSFSFQAPQAISQFVILALVVGAVVVLRVLAQIERDAILSRLSGTEAGELGKDFYLKALAYGGLPVLTVIGTQYPAVSHFISAWAQPTLAAMH